MTANLFVLHFILRVLLQGLRWTRAPVKEHMFNRLRLAARPHLVSLAGGTVHLPITDPAARCSLARRLKSIAGQNYHLATPGVPRWQHHHLPITDPAAR